MESEEKGFCDYNPIGLFPRRMKKDKKNKKDVTIGCVFLYDTINSFTRNAKEHCCFATNKTLAEEIGCNPRSIQNYLRYLRENHYIKIYTRINTKANKEQRFMVTLEEKRELPSEFYENGFYEVDENDNKIGDRIGNSTYKGQEDYVPPITKQVEKAKKEIDYQSVYDLYNRTCIDMPKVTKTSAKREKAIKSVLNTYTTEELKNVFTKAQESDFLSGRSTDWSATFDWLSVKNNIQKVIEGNYDNRKNKQATTATKNDDNYKIEFL